LATVGLAWDELSAARQRHEALALGAREREARAEVARLTLAEIDRVAPRAGEDADLQAERGVLANAERLTALAQDAFAALYDADAAALGQLAIVWKRVDDLSRLDPSFTAHRGARDAVQPILDDLAISLRDYLSTLDRSPDRLQQVEDRLAAIERLRRKYGPTLDDVLGAARRARETLSLMEATQDQRAEVEQALEGAERAYRAAAEALSASRRTAAVDLGRRLQTELATLAMEKATTEFRLEGDVSAPERWTRTGFDQGQIYIAANAGEQPRPLARIASGGELSRVMLALKTLATTDGAGKTLIFDEVDAGISGRVADTIGRRLRELGRRFQVICITHLPQVAAHATTHFQVSKRTQNGRTVVSMTRLGREGRIEELARLLAAREVTASARVAAAEMLAQGGESESPAEAKGESVARTRRGMRR
jgi:DNA repair protein RecN (Recombination protein N)